MSAGRERGISEFLKELSGFARTAEDTLKSIEEAPDENKGLFSVFSERMFTIRGTAQQLELPHIARIARLGEELAIKGTTADSRRQIRNCLGSLWDALTTVKYLLEHPSEETSEEQGILIHRLENALQAFGGARPTFDDAQIEALLARKREKKPGASG